MFSFLDTDAALSESPAAWLFVHYESVSVILGTLITLVPDTLVPWLALMLSSTAAAAAAAVHTVAVSPTLITLDQVLSNAPRRFHGN